MSSAKINYQLLHKEREKLLNEKLDQIMYSALNRVPTKPYVSKAKNKCFDKECDEVGTYKLTDCDGEVHALFCQKHKGNINRNIKGSRQKKRNTRYANVYGFDYRSHHHSD